MNKVKLFADTTCDLPKELLGRYDISTASMYVTLGDESRRDDELPISEIFAYADRTKQTPKTAAVTIEDFIVAFRPFIEAGRDIVYVGISAKFSSSVQNAAAAAAEFPKGRIEVVDSMNLSSGVGLLLMMAGDLAEQGALAAEIAAKAREATPRVHTSFVIDTLLYLYRGGRCSALQAFGANALGLKPSIVVEEGLMRPDKKYRGNIVRCAEKYASDVLAGAANADRRRAFVTHSPSDAELVEAVRAKVAASGLFDEIYVADAGSIVSCHCGPNTIGVLYMDQ